MYSINGITFIINTTGLLEGTGIAGTVNGEEYIRNTIPLNHVTSIYIPNNIKDVVLSQLQLCSLQYGSTPIENKIQGLFREHSNNPQLLNIIARYNDAYNQVVLEYNRRIAGQRLDNNQLTNLRIQLFSEYYNPIELECTNLYIQLLSNKLTLPVQQIMNMTLLQFIQNYLVYSGLNIPIVHTL